MQYRTEHVLKIAISAAISIIACPSTSIAANLQASSASPIVSFDDTSQADGAEWYIWGTDEIFAIQDVNAQTTILNAQTATSSTALGYLAVAAGANSLALGHGAEAATSSSTAIGHIASAEGADSLAVGYGAWAFGQQGAAFGNNASAFGLSSVALGKGASSSAAFSAAQGSSALASGDYAVATGANTIAEGYASLAQGSSALALGERSLAIGPNTEAGGQWGIALGYNAEVVGASGVALGYNAFSDLASSVALGHNAAALHTHSVALGSFSGSSGSRSVAIGYLATAESLQSTALGALAVADQPDTVILGAIAGVNSATVSANVGVGTTAPLAPLHVARDDGTAGILVQENALDPAGRTLFTLANRGNTKFEIKETGSGTRWQFTNSGDAFRVSKFGTGQVEFQVKNNGDAWVLGDMIVGGTLLELSDRNQKHTIVRLDGVSVLDKLAQVPVSEWSYKGESADQRHIGPMAQDFHAAFGLASGETRISARDMAGVNMAAVKALAAENRALKSANSELEGRISRLEALLVPWDGELALR